MVGDDSFALISLLFVFDPDMVSARKKKKSQLNSGAREMFGRQSYFPHRFIARGTRQKTYTI